MSDSQNSMPREILKQELIRRARECDAFRKLVVDHPQEACGQLGFRIPGASGESVSYLGAVELMYSRREFYSWYFRNVRAEFHEPAPAPRNDGHWEHMEWDFEVTKYAPAGAKPTLE